MYILVTFKYYCWGSIIQDVEDELHSIISVSESSARDQLRSSGFSDLLECKRALIIGVGLVFFQQITGQPSVLYYTVSIFKSAGFNVSKPEMIFFFNLFF